MGKLGKRKGVGFISNLTRTIPNHQSPQNLLSSGTVTSNNGISGAEGKEVIASCSVKREEGQIIIKVFGVNQTPEVSYQ
jgi:hypothetical protein